MRAMILAAGRGERMRPLSDTTPKPLLRVAGKPLILWHIENLKKAGFEEIVINIAHLGEQIVDFLSDGGKFGVKIHYSDERDKGALESAGGIKKALDFLSETFLVVNGDIFCSYEFNADFTLHNSLAHLILVPNPPHNTQGDFGLKNALLTFDIPRYTFSGIGYYSKALFEDVELQKSPLAPLLRQHITKNEISGELFNNMWHDIGTPQRLKEINEIYV